MSTIFHAFCFLRHILQKAITNKIISIIVLVSLIAGNFVQVVNASTSGVVPDYISLNYVTVPNVLLADITSQSPIIGSRVEGVLELRNPLRDFYLSLNVSSSDDGLITPKTLEASIWANTLHMLPPGNDPQNFDIQFTSTDQWVRVESSPLDTQSFVMNLIIFSMELFPGVSGKSKNVIVKSIGDYISLKEKLQGFMDLAEIGDLIKDPISWHTPSRLISVAEGLKAFYDSPVGKKFLVEALLQQGIVATEDQITQVFSWLKIYGITKKVADGLVYAFISGWSGSAQNKYLITPQSINPINRPPLPPKVIEPISSVTSRTPTFKWGDVLHKTSFLLQVSNSSSFSSNVINVSLDGSIHSYTSPVILAADSIYYWRVYARNNVGLSEFNIGTFTTAPITYPQEPPNPTTNDSGSYISDLTLSDGSIVSAGQTLTKTWRLKNNGTTTWGAGYKLAFVNGEQMGAPLTIDTGTVAPNATVDLSVSLTSPAATGEHTGYFQLRNPQGTYFGPRIWVKIMVQANNVSSGNITTFDISPSSPSQASQVHLVGRINSFTDFRSMRFVVGNQVSEMPNFRQVGGQFEISTDWDTASLPRGNYAIVLEVAKTGDTSWASPERRVQTYTLNGTPTSTNRPPDRPVLLSPYNWYLEDAGGSSSSVQLCVQPAADPDGNSVMYSFEVNGGAITSGLVSSCWSYTFNPGTYSWRVKTSDGSLYSDWSNDTWNFTVAKGGVYIGGMSLYSPNTGDTHICVPITYDGIIAPDPYAWINLATDGSQNGEWKLLDHYGPNASPDCTAANVHGWWIRSQDYETGTHAIKVTGVKRDTGANASAVFSYSIAYMRPPAPQPLAPSSNSNNGTWWTSPIVTFQWGAVSRVTSYTLRASTNMNPWADGSPLLNVDLGPDVTSYNYDFGQDYSAIYWSVRANNSAGSADTGGGIWFGIDRVMPSCQIQALPSVSYENIFKVTWGGIDNSAGIRNYDIQYRDSGRDEWIDWQTSVPASRTYDLFNGQPGHTYEFHCRTTDNAGNMSSYPAGYDTALKIDPAARPPEPWWNSAYFGKRNLTVLNNMPQISLPAGYPVRIQLNAGTSPSAAEVYNSSLSTPKCNDVRIVANNSTELSRVVLTCSSSSIDIIFRTQVQINAGSSDSTTHQIYFGNSSPGTPPSDPGVVFYPSKDANTVGVWYTIEGQGTIAYDQSGNNLTCYLDGTTSWISSGKFISGFHFLSGTDGATVDCGASSLYNTQNLTIEFYFRSTNNNLWGRFAGNMGAGSQRWALSTNDNKPCIQVWAVNGGNGICTNQAYVDGAWHHAAFTLNGTQMAIYIDGQLNATGSLPGVIKSGNLPLTIGSYENGARSFAEMTGIRLSNIARTSFPYASFVNITNEPSVAVGSTITPAIPGSPDLVILSLNTSLHTTGGVLVEATVKNQGTVPTLNGFFTDLYVDHLPTGSGDLTGSYKFWVNDPIDPAATATLTTIIDQVPAIAALLAAVPGEEKITTLYAQVDSTGAVTESTKSNNISQGAQVCVANADAYEIDGSASVAVPITLGQPQLHNFTSQSDQDWVSFTATAGQKYILKTYNLGPSADTYLYLYGQDGETLLDSNDDDGSSLASRIEWEAPATGTYYILVRDWDPNVSGCGTGYTLSVGFPILQVFLPAIVR